MSVLAIVLSMVFAFGLAGCGDSDETEEPNAEKSAEKLAYDPAEPPSNIREVVVLSGTPKEMGKQYGQQAADSLSRLVTYKKALAIEKFGSIDKAYEALDDYADVYSKGVPEVLEMFRGMAETSGISYDDILVTYTQFVNNPHRNCSTISMWGDATVDGKTICGANYDLTLEPYIYEPSVVAYPKNGNAFMAGSGLIGGTYMNDKGLVILGSQGQDWNKEDLGVGVAPKVGLLEIAMTCKTAKEAKKLYIDKVAPGSGENMHVIDADNNKLIVEHTAAKDSVRTSGDFGEQDYMIATNTFLTEKMQDSIYQGDEFWDDALPRYWTEQKIIEDNMGANTIDTLNDALGSTKYFVDQNWYSDVWEKEEFVGYKDMENGVWSDDNWDITDKYTGFWTPENREAATECICRTVCVPEDLTMYVMAGCRDTYSSTLPNATGNFWKLSLEKNPVEVVEVMENQTQIQVYIGSRDTEIAAALEEDETREEDLTTAKTSLYEGMSYKNLAKAESDKTTRLEYFSKALNAYCKAYCYAQLAQNDTKKLIREGGEYEVY